MLQKLYFTGAFGTKPAGYEWGSRNLGFFFAQMARKHLCVFPKGVACLPDL